MEPIQYEDASKKFHKPGTERLTYYEFRCGYIQQVQTPDCTVSSGKQLTLWMEHGAFHVRAHDFGEHKRIFWDVFSTMTEANRRYFKAKRELQLQ